MYCVSTSNVNTIQEAVKYQYCKVEVGTPAFKDDITAVETADNILKGILNCSTLEIEKNGIWIKEN